MPVVSNHERRKKAKKLHHLICYVHKGILKTFHLSSKKSLCNFNLKFSDLVSRNCNIWLLHSFLQFKADI